jgi:cytochrome c oxidase cbb3-type subunit III
MKSRTANYRKWVGVFTAFPFISFASQGQILSGETYFSNSLFITLLIVIILLLIINVALTQALKNIANSDYVVKNAKEARENNSGKITGFILLFSVFSLSTYANNITPAKKDWLIGGLDMGTFYLMMGVILIEVIILTVLLYTLQFLLRNSNATVKKEAVKENVILQKLTGAVAIEKEEEIMLGHEYDGIRELDNDLPPWWKYGFYLTIVVSVVYLIHYHVAGTGDLQLTEYTKEIEKGKQEVAEFMKNAANNVDETNVKLLEGAEIESGKQVFISNCAACHGRLGEGGVGPNLTDGYWMHGGSLADVFKSIKYGWPDKGMKSWKEDLSPVQIAQITSFIKSISGTNPPNGKAAQGDLFQEAPAPTDSLNLQQDSTRILNTDTLKNLASGENSTN